MGRSGTTHLATGGVGSTAETEAPKAVVGLNNGSCVRLRARNGCNHVWSYDFVSAMTHDGGTLRLLVPLDEYTRECLAILVARGPGSYWSD